MNQKTLVTGFVLLVVLPLAVLAGIYFLMQPGKKLAESSNTTAGGSEFGDDNRGGKSAAKLDRPDTPVVHANKENAAKPAVRDREVVDSGGTGLTQDAAKSTEQKMTDSGQASTVASSGSTPPPANLSGTGMAALDFEKPVKETFESELVRVVFPDTMEVMKEGKKIRVRLESVASPRKGQPFHEDARQFVEELIANSPAQVHQTGDSRGMLYGYVIIDGKNIGNEMLRNGFGWHYKRVSKSAELAKLENEAREAKRGLWADENPTPPWDWKK